MTRIADDLLQRISARAHDPMRRTAMSAVEANARPLDLDSLSADLRRHAPPQGLLGALGKMQSLFGGKLPGMAMIGSGGMLTLGTLAGPREMSAPAGEEQFDAA